MKRRMTFTTTTPVLSLRIFELWQATSSLHPFIPSTNYMVPCASLPMRFFPTGKRISQRPSNFLLASVQQPQFWLTGTGCRGFRRRGGSHYQEIQKWAQSGPDGIPPKLLKYVIGPISFALHSVFTEAWRTGLVPDWRDEIIVTIQKERLQGRPWKLQTCTLLSLPGKVFVDLLLARIQPLLMKTCRPQRSGFTLDLWTLHHQCYFCHETSLRTASQIQPSLERCLPRLQSSVRFGRL